MAGNALTSIPGIPYHSDRSWREANDSILRVIQKNRQALAIVRQTACQIEKDLSMLSNCMAHLAVQTCGYCPLPCCCEAKVWFDFRDLLFLHINNIALPGHQTRSRIEEPCRFLGPKGCRLQRARRPFICTWYLCPVQTRRLNHEPLYIKDSIDTLIETVKQNRKKLETDFIEMIVSF